MAAASRHARLIAAVHVAAKAHGLDSDTYHDLVMDETGKESSKNCTVAELCRLLDRLNGRKTFRPSDRPEIRKIHAQWGELRRRGVLDNPTRAGLRAFCARMARTGDAATDPEFLTTVQAVLVIEALKAWMKRTAP